MAGIAAIHSTFEADPILGELVQAFVEDVPDRCALLEQLAAAEDWESLTITAHQLKGAFGGYGFDSLMDSARILESALRDQRAEAVVRAALDELVGMCRLVRHGDEHSGDEHSANEHSGDEHSANEHSGDEHSGDGCWRE